MICVYYLHLPFLLHIIYTNYCFDLMACLKNKNKKKRKEKKYKVEEQEEEK